MEERGRGIVQHVEVVTRVVGGLGCWYWLHLVPPLMR